MKWRAPLLSILTGFLLLLLSACASVAPPDKAEMMRLRSGEQSLILIRVEVRGESEEKLPIFEDSLSAGNIGIGIGGFETGGEPVPVEAMRFLSKQSRADGWFYLIVRPGTHYVVFQTPQRGNAWDHMESFKRLPRWRIDVTRGSLAVYGGTMVLLADMEEDLFGGLVMLGFRGMSVIDQTSLAERVIDRDFPGHLDVATSLMTRHSGPIILSAPEG